MNGSLESIYTGDDLRDAASWLLTGPSRCRSLEKARSLLLNRLGEIQAIFPDENDLRYSVVRDCARALRGMLLPHSEDKAGFSVLQRLLAIQGNRPGSEASPAFHAEFIHLFRGLEGRAETEMLTLEADTSALSGREAAARRSDDLDRIWEYVDSWMERWKDGLSDDAVSRRVVRRRHVLEALGGSERDWQDWRWHTHNVVTSPEELSLLVPGIETGGVEAALRNSVPFAVTPYYASLMEPGSGDRDRALRAQVVPSGRFVESFASARSSTDMDFMRERDTSPVDLVTRRYPAIAILKPYNSCPQICVYCQRNWEIEEAMSPTAMASDASLDEALRWIADHVSIREVLVTGGDPLAMDDDRLGRVLRGVASIDHVDLVRIGTRTPVTMPMRFTPALLDLLSDIRSPGRREVVVVTHIQHPYEITPETVRAVDAVRMRGIGVYNQLVYTYYVSRRFEAAKLRMLLRRSGIDPYYTFVPKGKLETAEYRVPIARILQEYQEEARLLPGTRRTDTPVYNVPGLGKNYLLAYQNRDLVSVMPDGSRYYEFHPWEKNLARQRGYPGWDVPVLDYLSRLAADGEDISDYSSIWYYY